MNADAAVAAACRLTGLEDFGGNAYREGLEVLVDAIAAEARLTPRGGANIAGQIVHSMANRLRVVAWTAEHPEAQGQAVARPVFVLGLARTGTTLLLNLLRQDPANRCLLRWEARRSVPPPDAARPEDDPRLAAARDQDRQLHLAAPDLRAIHYEHPDGPTECLAVLGQDFRSMGWGVMANVPTYADWLLSCDHSSAYAYHRRELQLLQWRAPGRWVLKSPQHCLGLEALTAVYPDARFVMTHRDPLTAVASVCSLVTTFARLFSDADHRADIARIWPRLAAAAVSRVSEFRDRHGDGAFHDILYADLVADPVATVRELYAFLGEDLTTQAEMAMADYAALHTQGRYGTHTYSPEDLGLDRRSLAGTFADYRHRYRVPPER